MQLFEEAYKKAFIRRFDCGSGMMMYHEQRTHKDFPGLAAEPISFFTPHGIRIAGNVYTYPGADEKRLVVFCHGIGQGHLSYITEIERICREGCAVIGYDNVGCGRSGGENIRGFTESLNDLIACIDFVRAQERWNKAELSVIGHSWGGYAVMNLPAYRDGIHAVVSISGFASVKLLFDEFFGAESGVPELAYAAERQANPDYADACAAEALAHTDARVLLIHSADDRSVSPAIGLEYVRSRISGGNVRFLLTDGKSHTPQYTRAAAELLVNTQREYARLVAQRKLVTDADKRRYVDGCDFAAMTAQDEDIWREIFAQLK